MSPQPLSEFPIHSYNPISFRGGYLEHAAYQSVRYARMPPLPIHSEFVRAKIFADSFLHLTEAKVVRGLQMVDWVSKDRWFWREVSGKGVGIAMSETMKNITNTPVFWPQAGLVPGPYPVGFRSGFLPDASRRYDYGLVLSSPKTGTRKSARPILFAIWYPAQVSPEETSMCYGDYLQLETELAAGLPEPLNQALAPKLIAEEEMQAFARELEIYATEEFMDATLGVSSMSLLDDAKRPLLDALLKSPVPAFKNAPNAAGAFPLLVYHSGLSGSYEENSIICEYLASCGYIVVSSAYPSASAAYLNIDGDREKTLADMQFIIGKMRLLDCVDGRHAAAMGHSFGACASFLLRKRNDAVDAILSFDSTLDYSKWLTEKMIKEYGGAGRELACPMLITANGTAEFSIARGLNHADRYLMRVEDLGHEGFLAHAVIRTGISADIKRNAQANDEGQRAGASGAETSASGTTGSETSGTNEVQASPNSSFETSRIHQAYVLQCKAALQFLQRTFRGDPNAHETLLGLVESASSSSLFAKIEHIPAEPAPPTLKDLVQRIKNDGARSAVDWCRGLKEAEEPFFGRYDLNRLGYLQTYAGRPEEAVEIFLYMMEIYPEAADGWDSLAEGYIAIDQPQEALIAYRKAIEVLDQDPSLNDESRALDKAQYEKAIAIIEKELGLD